MVDSPSRKAFEKGDFNGDGKTDYAVLITKDDRIYAIVLLAEKKSFKAYNLLGQNEQDRWIAGIDVMEKGQMVDVGNENNPAKSLRLKTDAIRLYDGEGMGQIFYWQSGEFLSESEI